MSATVDHPVFEAPEDPNVRIWRYMDFSKFVSLLASDSLYFPRADFLDDPYEGATSHANEDLRPGVYGGVSADVLDAIVQQRSTFSEWFRQCTYVNCWHMNRHESAALWKLYSTSDESIAVQSSYSRFRDCLPEEAYLGRVRYIDYDRDWMPEGNTFYPYVHKRKSFKHETELRAVIQRIPKTKNPEGTEVPAFGQPNSEIGIRVPIHLPDLIEKIYISPTAPSWFELLVESVSAKYGLDKPILKSSLSRTPVY